VQLDHRYSAQNALSEELMATQEQLCRVSELLKNVASGVIPSSAALKLTEEWRDIPWHEEALEDAYHLLQHFDADADIRQRDRAYSDAQVKSLTCHARRLVPGGGDSS
jgi:hypothetical protein